MRMLFATLLTLSLLASPAGATEPRPAEPASTQSLGWTAQVDPLTTLLGFVHVQVERRLTDHVSVYLGPHLRLFSPPFGDVEKFTGYGAEVGVRWYFLGGAPRGWWMLARGVVAQLHADIEGVAQSNGGGYASVLGGYTFILSDRFVLSLGLGAQYLHYTIEGMGPDGVLPAAHTALGLAF